MCWMRVPRTVLIAWHRRNLSDKNSRWFCCSSCHGVVGFTMNDGTEDYEVSISGKWPQRAKAMKSEVGSLTCTTSQLTVRIEEALSRNVRTVPARLEDKLVDVSLWRHLCTCEANRGVVDSARTASNSRCNSGKSQIGMSSRLQMPRMLCVHRQRWCST